MGMTNTDCFRIAAASFAGARWAAFWTVCMFALIFWQVVPHEMAVVLPLTYGVALVLWFGCMLVVLTLGLATFPAQWAKRQALWALIIGFAAAGLTFTLIHHSATLVGDALRAIDIPLYRGTSMTAGPFLFGMIGVWSGVSAAQTLGGTV